MTDNGQLNMHLADLYEAWLAEPMGVWDIAREIRFDRVPPPEKALRAMAEVERRLGRIDLVPELRKALTR